MTPNRTGHKCKFIYRNQPIQYLASSDGDESADENQTKRFK